MSVIPLEYVSPSVNTSTLYCSEENTFLSDEIINYNNVIIKDGCINIYFPVIYFNSLLNIESISISDVNLYLPILDIPSLPPYKYDQPVTLFAGKYRYIQYSFVKPPIVIEVPTPSPPYNPFLGSTDTLILTFIVDKNGNVLPSDMRNYIKVSHMEQINDGLFNIEVYNGAPYNILFTGDTPTYYLTYMDFSLSSGDNINSTPSTSGFTYSKSICLAPPSSFVNELKVIFPKLLWGNDTVDQAVIHKSTKYGDDELTDMFPFRFYLALKKIAIP